MFTIKAFGMLRISEEGELEGLDIHDHGAPAYHPEPAYQGYSPIPPQMEGVIPSGPPSDIHLPSSTAE
jgi:Amt family ammonium transporter